MTSTESSQSNPETQSPEAPESPMSEQAALQARVTELEAQLKEKESKYVYLYAEFENFKKRAVKDRADTLKFGWEPVARELLQVVDNLERAVEHMPAGTDANFAKGIEMVIQQFRSTLQKQGVEAVPTTQASFDPNLHEAVGQEPSQDHPQGTILKEHLKGYTLHGRLLRPARVVISGG